MLALVTPEMNPSQSAIRKSGLVSLLQRQALAIFGLLLALATAWAVTRPLRTHADFMDYVQDDFFYYLKVAQNVAAGRGSTFNGLIATNGYHPLWMWTLAGVIFLFGIKCVPVFLAVSIWLGTVTTYLLSGLLLRRSGAGPVAAAGLATYLAVYAMHVFNYGMEVTLAVPLALLLLLLLHKDEWWSADGGSGAWRALLVGLTASALVLARIDTILLVALLGLAAAFQPVWRRRFRPVHAVGLGVGLIPLLGYFVANHLFFHVWLPVSGLSKQLKLDHGFTLPAWQSLFSKSPTQLLNLAPVILALVLLPYLWRRLSPALQAIGPPVLAFPFVYIAVLSWSSDWQLWGWYFYMLRPALLMAFLVLLGLPAFRKALQWRPVLALLVLVALARIGSVHWNEQQPEIVAAARQVKGFAQTHPGVYAMGDRSGAVGYLVPDPVIQTEGLMMDADYIHLVSQQLPLREVLQRYGVRYYIGSAQHPYQGCFEAIEPVQAGPHAPHLHSEFCEKPLAEWTFNGVRTMVYDMK